MTVRELKEALAAYPDDMEVVYADSEWGNSPVKAIETEAVFDGDNELNDVLVLSEY